MKIGIIAHLKYPINKPFMGGLEAFTYDICQRLLARGHDVLLYACAGSDPILNVRPILCEDDYHPITSSQFTSRQLSTEYISTHHAYVELMQEIDKDELDVIFNNSLNYVPIMMSALVKAPMVTVLHTPPIFELKNAIRREQYHGRIKYVSVSASNARNWKDYAPQCNVIHNGIDLAAWQFYPENDGGYIMWFGRIHPDKGLHLAIEAAKLAGKKMKVAGAISDAHYYETEILPRLDESIELLGPCDHRQLNELIGHAEAAVITPCWEEPFGLVVAEALACGTPVAGIAKGALPYLLDERTGKLCSGDNVQELGDCILAAGQLDRLDCRQRAEELFDVEKMVDSYEALFNKISIGKREMKIKADVS
ncbi:Glycosyltransferase involved in cell wall bisynthesis [Dyadobacter soli]|uniref:Glycosyltransferase involved in cell wall bisynthesis n=1 Tax=Dyadobacter soli TaxID=659014 RepID=A0A1G7VMM2_9BACT|nr:glycosyltransferase family 4 protein [Dyadobacter soli]SDG61055.1 Glycosyltransferase involved in cell wall bisynthesis [Dyadobacter soli]